MNIIKKTIKDNNMKERGNIFYIIRGSVISIILTLIALIIFSVILANTQISENTMKPVITVISAISILIGSIVSVSKIKKMGIVNGAIVGGIYIIIIYVLSSIISSNFSINLSSLILMVASIIAGILGGIIGVNIKR